MEIEKQGQATSFQFWCLEDALCSSHSTTKKTLKTNRQRKAKTFPSIPDNKDRLCTSPDADTNKSGSKEREN